MARRPTEYTHRNLLSIEVDLLEPDQVAKAAKDIANSHNIKHLVHNVGLIWPNLIEDTNRGDITGLAHALWRGIEPDTGHTTKDEIQQIWANYVQRVPRSPWCTHSHSL